MSTPPQKSPTPPSRFAQRPPRLNIKNMPPNMSAMSPRIQPSTARPPMTAQSHHTAAGGQPYWSNYSNPFGAGAGNFMAKGLEGFVDFTKSGMSFGEKFIYKLYEKLSKWSKKWFTHVFLFIVVALYTAGGAYLFKAIEGKSEKQVEKEVETILKAQADIHTLQKDFYMSMRTLSEKLESKGFNLADFNSNVTYTLREHQTAVESLLNVNKTKAQIEQAQNPWSFWNSMVFCGTVYTTIGYGNITPKTNLGKTLTIIYAIIGIPLFLILLADFGKVFTRILKVVWSYVRRVYYTGTCRKIRKQQQVRDALGGINAVYDMALRRPSQYFSKNENEVENGTNRSVSGSHPETPTSIYPETFQIDDEFNLPISVATVLLISYILIGAFVYTRWETWSYFDSIYFVFISMSTIGFGDIVPAHPIFMMLTIIYLIGGLALTSMFINVVQIKLSDTFKQASVKLSTTIGFELPEGEFDEGDDDNGDGDNKSGDMKAKKKSASEIAAVHGRNSDDLYEDAQDMPATSRKKMSTSNSRSVGESDETPPPPLPKRQTFAEQPPEVEKKKKRKFF